MHGGHNGLRDLIAAQGDGFWRLRIGVGHPGDENEVVDVVLARAGKDEQRAIETASSRARTPSRRCCATGAQIAMNRTACARRPGAATRSS